MLLKALNETRMPGPNLLKNRWISQITSFPIDKVVWWNTKDMEVADALSQTSWWHEMATSDDDPTVWPAFLNTTVLETGERERISKQIMQHCRHDTKCHAPNGVHS